VVESHGLSAHRSFLLPRLEVLEGVCEGTTIIVIQFYISFVNASYPVKIYLMSLSIGIHIS
jgi:hypothetical protein